MSSAILYLAIVAIWAVVLVPRWLRPRVAPPQPVPVPAELPDAESRESAGPRQGAGVAPSVSADGPGSAGGVVGGEAMAAADVSGDGADVSGEDGRDGEAAPEAGVTAPGPALRRAEVLKARRRLLGTLIMLTVIAVGLVATGIDAYWIVVPPAVLLTGYVVLLRQFAHIDAERARSDARTRRAQAGQEPAAPREPVPASAAGESDIGPVAASAPRGAEIIDISARVGDQVYDQYSDEANRAVGD